MKKETSYITELSIVSSKLDFAEMFRGLFDVRGRGKSYSRKKYFAVKFSIPLSTRKFIKMLRKIADQIETEINKRNYKR